MMSPPAADGWYLVECYRPRLAELPLDDAVARLDLAAGAGSTGTQLVLAVCAPDDEMLYTLFRAPSVHSVVEACQRAGLPADRISVGVDARINTAACRRPPGDITARPGQPSSL
ncbi:MAG: hypothetical protein SW019_22080 [Actinomycetota bacterium]|nr:hypothetical protein [Actinomycetota bacterium]